MKIIDDFLWGKSPDDFNRVDAHASWASRRTVAIVRLVNTLLVSAIVALFFFQFNFFFLMARLSIWGMILSPTALLLLFASTV